MEKWIPIIISGFSLFISLVTSWNTWWRSRASLKIEKLDSGTSGIFFKSIDGCLQSYSFEPTDSRPIFHSVILVDIIITNKSALPISILEFSISDFPEFNSYSYTEDSFRVTYEKNRAIVIGEDIPIKYLKPEFTIDPYTSVRGHLFFWAGQERDLDIRKEIPLTVKTSRKSFTSKIKIDSQYESIKKRVRISKNDDGTIIKEFL